MHTFGGVSLAHFCHLVCSTKTWDSFILADLNEELIHSGERERTISWPICFHAAFLKYTEVEAESGKSSQCKTRRTKCLFSRE